MKKIHLICNSHIDPIWQWEWEEGAAAAFSTFNSAVNLLNEFDFIFCHNEALLYKYTENYNPDLFKKIKKLVKNGKWHIMGGWFLQPDCNMPSGESIVRQIQSGRYYFKKKFNKIPDTAINLDPFGHSIGLVQILKKCGYHNYIITRPDEKRLPLKLNQFIWQGLDGSEIKVVRCEKYGCLMGHAAKEIIKTAEKEKSNVITVLWGLGNHGGGPSRSDLEQIEILIKKNDYDVIHSFPENFFSEIKPQFKFNKALIPVFPGCYSTNALIKKKHIELENQLYFTEKICSAAYLINKDKYPTEEFILAEEDLLKIEFHDILAGCSTRTCEEWALNTVSHGLAILNNIKAKAFFSLVKGEKKADTDEYPIFVFNPNPYILDTDIEVEFTLMPSHDNLTDDTLIYVYDENGSLLKSQVIKEESNLNWDCRQRVVFSCKLKPFNITRFNIKTALIIKKDIKKDILFFEGKYYTANINPLTGRMDSFVIAGNKIISDYGITAVIYDDNPDPWAMSDSQIQHIGDNREIFDLCKNPEGVFKGLKSVETIEDGEIYTAIECFFEKNNSKIRTEYRFFKERMYFDLKIDLFFNDSDKVVKIEIPVLFKGTYIGQTAFGTDNLFENGKECVAQRFVAVKNDNGKCFAILNNCNYASSFEKGVISVTLLRGATYCAHPIGERQLIPDDRFVKKIDQGERSFHFRFMVCDETELERYALEFNQKPYALNYFPTGIKNTEKNFVFISNNPNIVNISFKKRTNKNKFVIRLINNSIKEQDAIIKINKHEVVLKFSKYEVKTLLYSNNFLKEKKEMIV